MQVSMATGATVCHGFMRQCSRVSDIRVPPFQCVVTWASVGVIAVYDITLQQLTHKLVKIDKL